MDPQKPRKFGQILTSGFRDISQNTSYFYAGILSGTKRQKRSQYSLLDTPSHVVGVDPRIHVRQFGWDIFIEGQDMASQTKQTGTIVRFLKCFESLTISGEGSFNWRRL